MIIEYHRDLTKSYQKLPSQIKSKLKERLLLFEQDQFNPILNNHALKGQYQGYRSINITGDLRALYKTDGEKILFIAIGSHSNLYG